MQIVQLVVSVQVSVSVDELQLGVGLPIGLVTQVTVTSGGGGGGGGTVQPRVGLSVVVVVQLISSVLLTAQVAGSYAPIPVLYSDVQVVQTS